MGQEDLIVTIAAATLALFLLSAGFILFFIFFSRSKRINMERQKEREISYIKELSGAKAEVQEQTLLNVSQELHDNIGQLLTVCKMKVDDLSTGSLSEGRAEVSGLLDNLIDEVKSYSRALNSDRLKNQGLYIAMCNELDRISRIGAIKVLNELDPEMSLTHPDHEVIVFRIFQEFLNNTLKHSEADSYYFKSNQSPAEFYFKMSDNGIGFDQALMEKNSSGLINMKSRAALIKAELEISSSQGAGTSLELRIPRFT